MFLFSENKERKKYQGDLTPEFIKDISSKLSSAIEYVLTIKEDTEGWIYCKNDWLKKLRYSGLRCAAIAVKLEYDIKHREEEDKEWIANILNLLSDFELAKNQNFLIEK